MTDSPNLPSGRRRGLAAAFNAAEPRPIGSPGILNATTDSGAVVTAGAGAAAAPIANRHDGVVIAERVPIVLQLQPPNYSTWRALFELLLQQTSLTEHLSSDARLDDPVWLQDDALVISWIYLRVSPDILGLIITPAPTTSTVWQAIRGLFLDNMEMQVIYLGSTLRTLEQGDSPVLAYFGRLKELADQLRDLGEPLTDHQLIM
ncbi:uncharacterized protein LOC112272477 [Brachypodium distachyon]|uniref:uncharacterized protein LOC112272477 n=1 Tax=Brachypodium distachyon TaxID=15368 RepID=UPI000D0E1B57|nr:uncharacterized protein LOC112272477 [Brachypodium distachyon]|eukprot:XP_024319143.1 uncharacterized protein LOC112272477 [Brachypodium distachyon]